MRHWITACGITALFALLATLASPASGADPVRAVAAPRRVIQIAPPPPTKEIYANDEQIQNAVEKARNWLMGQFRNGKLIDYDDAPDKPLQGAGADAFCAYALLQGPWNPPTREEANQLFDVLRTLKVQPEVGTYTRAMRIAALANSRRREDADALAADAHELMDTCRGGAFRNALDPADVGSSAQQGYLRPPKAWDNLNSTYGMLGVWSALESGVEIPEDFWKVLEKHWIDTQHADGGWGYDAASTDSTPSMTLGAVASLLACRDGANKGAQVGQEPFSPQVLKGLAWIAQGEHAGKDVTNGYAAFVLQRVGLVTGFKYFGAHEWCRELASRMVRTQLPDGSWPAADKSNPARVETAFNMLFLSHQRRMLMNKLRFEPFWNNRPRDLEHLGSYSGIELCLDYFRWQVVSLDRQADDWSDAPVLYIASHEPPRLADSDFVKLRAYVDQGGMLFTHADANSATFNAFVENTLVKKVFPEYAMIPLPADHCIVSMDIKLKQPLAMKMVSNGSRLLLVHSPTDLSQYWQQNAPSSHRDAFAMGLNVFLYAAGKTGLRHPSNPRAIPDPPPPAPGNTIRVARLRYLAAWNPEPGAWPRFARWMGWQTGVGISAEPVDIEALANLSPLDVPLAHLCGTAKYEINETQIKSLRQYVQAGGVLFIDGGALADFNDSVATMLERAFPKQTPKRIASSHPLLSTSDPGMSDLYRPELRGFAQSIHGSRGGAFHCFREGKGCVIISTLDVASGFLGTNTWGIDGYRSEYALKFMKNLTLWAARGAPDQVAAPPEPAH